MNIWKVSFFGLFLTLDLEKGSSLQASYSNAFAELVLMVKGALHQEALLSSFHKLVLQDLTKDPLSQNLCRGCSVQRVCL